MKARLGGRDERIGGGGGWEWGPVVGVELQGLWRVGNGGASGRGGGGEGSSVWRRRGGAERLPGWESASGILVPGRVARKVQVKLREHGEVASSARSHRGSRPIFFF